MRFAEIEASQWKEVKSIYMEAFPKRERKPFFVLKHSVKRGKARVFTASDENGLLGFTVAIPYQNMVMVDYLAVSGKIRSMCALLSTKSNDPEQRDRKLHHAGDMPIFFR